MKTPRNGRLRRITAVVAGLLLVSAMAGNVAAAGHGTWSVNDVSKVEGNSGTSTLTFTITYTPTATDTGNVTIVYYTTAGTASSTMLCGLLPGDFQPWSFGIATISTAPAASHAATVNVTVCGDTTIEADEVLTLSLIGPSNGTSIAKGTGVGTIVNDDGVTTTTLASSLNPSILGDSVTFTATVTGPTTPNGGTVTFRDGATTLGSATVSAGSATFTTSALSVGTHPITAAYGGDATHAPSTSASLSQVVNAPAPNIALDKTAAAGTFDAVGEAISYSYAVSNSGNVPLTGIAVADDKVNGQGGVVTCPVTSLGVGGSAVCTATYSVTQADLNAGQVVNVATASGMYGATTVSAGDTVTVVMAQSRGMVLVKAAAETSYAAVGDQIHYTYSIVNSGNVDLGPAQFTVADDHIAGGAAFDCGAAGTTLSPNTGTPAAPSAGSFVTCAATYSIVQGDIDLGHVTNTASASADLGSAGILLSPPTDVTVNAAQTAHVHLAKAPSTTTFVAAGDDIVFSYTVTNDGNITLSNPAVADDHINGGTPFVCGAGGPLAPLALVTCSAHYIVQPADVAAGSVVTSATAAASYGEGGTATSDPASVTLTLNAATPFESFQGVTSDPSTVTTLPPTTTGGGPQEGGSAPLFVLLICLGLAGIGLFSVETQRRGIRR